MTALVELAAGDDFKDRADAGRALASFAQAPESCLSGSSTHHANLRCSHDCFMVFSSERDQAVEAYEDLSLDASAQVRQGAAALGETLAEIRPVLYPQEPV